MVCLVKHIYAYTQRDTGTQKNDFFLNYARTKLNIETIFNKIGILVNHNQNRFGFRNLLTKFTTAVNPSKTIIYYKKIPMAKHIN